MGILIFLSLAASLFSAGISLGGQRLEVEIADTDALRSRGLMHRSELADGAGMLFVYEKAQPLHFWMKNTPLSLTIAFFDGEKRVINMLDMAPPSSGEKNLKIYSSERDARYALEVPQGWFEKHKIRPGMKFSFLDPGDQVE